MSVFKSLRWVAISAALTVMFASLVASPAQAAAVGAPGVPGSLRASAGVRQVTLTWQAPGSAGSTPLQTYEIKYSTASDMSGASSKTVLAQNLTTDITALSDSTSYYFQVAATNSNGTGSYSAIISSKTFTTPGSPVFKSVTGGANSFNLSWSAPGVNGGSAVTGYVLDYSTDSTFSTGVNEVTLGNVTSYSLSGSTDVPTGTTYSFRIAAVSSVGQGVWSATQTKSSFGVPAAPTVSSATGFGQSVRLAWGAPASNGSAITGYKVTYSTTSDFSGDVNTATTGNVRGYTITGLTNSTCYYVYVVATNAMGDSSPSNVGTDCTFSTPGAPEPLTGLATSPNKVKLSWVAPAASSKPVTGYRIEWTTDDNQPFTDSMNVGNLNTAVVTGLTAGTLYYFKVAAISSVGLGDFTNEANIVTLITPDAPTSVTAATAANNNIAVSWTAPLNTGNPSFSSYKIQYSTNSAFPTASTYTGFAKANATSFGIASLGTSRITAGTVIYVRMAAVNTAGTSAWSSSANATSYTWTKAAAPTAISITKTSCSTASITITMPANTGGTNNTVTGYSVQYNGLNLLDNSQATTIDASAATVSGSTRTFTFNFNQEYLINGDYSAINASNIGPSAAITTGGTNDYGDINYNYFRVAIVNKVGTGDYSSIVGGTTDMIGLCSPAPGTPTLALVGPTAIKVLFTAPTYSGTIYGYDIEYTTDSTWATYNAQYVKKDLMFPGGTASTSGFQITNLKPSTTYYFRVGTETDTGPGTWSSVSNISTVAGIVMPSNVNITYGNGVVSATWTALGSVAANTTYSLEVIKAGAVVYTQAITATSSSANMYQLAGTGYQAYIKATYAPSGYTASIVSASFSGDITAAAPGAPTSVSSSKASSKITVTWAAPTLNNGAAITGYKIFMQTATGSFVQQGSTVGPSVLTYTTGTLATGKTYSFYIQAVNSAGTSSNNTSQTSQTL